MQKTKSGTIVASNVICGPLACSFHGRGKWLVQQYCDVKAFFDVVKNLDRKQMYNKFIYKKYDTGN